MMTNEITEKIRQLEAEIEKLKKQIEPVGFEDDCIFLLSVSEYERYKESIPLFKTWWWLRSPGHMGGSAALVLGAGGVNFFGDYVYDDIICVRPALKYSNLKSEIIKSEINPNRFVFNDFSFVIIDEVNEIAIAEVPIETRRFDAEYNNYETSEIRKWLLDWMEGNR